MKKKYYYILFLILGVSTWSCIEEFNAGTIEFEDALVIEASITNEFKNQKVVLSRTYKFEEFGPSAESGATVQISTGSTIYTFSESSPGVYLSDIQFGAEQAKEYQLFIATNDGREFISDSTPLTNNSVIDNLYALKGIDEDGVEGVGIYVDSYDAANNSKYYGYEFEETFQIIVPFWTSEDLILVSENPPQFDVVPRTQEERECYQTTHSQGRILTNTNLLTEDRISKFLIKFIPIDDLSLNSRYSILVKQYIQSSQAYNYRKTLNDFSSSESLFSQNQPGFLAGNITSVNHANEKVIGFFEVSSVASQRIFFNRSEVLEEPFDWFCSIFDPPISELAGLVRNDRVTLYYEKPEGEEGGPFDVVLAHCGDCTKLGTNNKPSFWVD